MGKNKGTKKKKPTATKRHAPEREVPVPGQGALRSFSGVYAGLGVWVTDARAMRDLFASGFYGKGNLSRMRPEYGHAAPQRKPKVQARALKKERQEGGFHVTSSRAPPPQAKAPPAEPEKRKRNEEAGDEGTEVKKLKANEEELDLNEDADSVPPANPVEVPVAEHLQLGLEEAFYLCYGLGCLEIFTPARVPMSVLDCWNAFRLAEPKFISHYVCFHYYRTRGWCVKSGLKYGTDFVLYKKGPTYTHADYAIVVVSASAEEKVDTSGRTGSWRFWLGMNRVNEQVSKDLVACYVLSPPEWSDEKAVSPECLSQFTIQEVHVRRLVP